MILPRSTSSLVKIFIILLIIVSLFMYVSFIVLQKPNFKQLESQSLYQDSNQFMKKYDHSLVLIYNRVPKTGSTSFINITHNLCKTRGFHVVYITISKTKHHLNLENQFKFVQNVTQWEEIKPVIYHGHFHYIDFEKFGSHIRPIYINVIRNPLERFVSYYYFLRFGDDYRPHVKRSRMSNRKVQMQTFDECVERAGQDCRPEKLWLQIPFFCGHEYYCGVVGNKNALIQAKHNVLHRYFMVGVTERMSDFIIMMERLLPQYFLGANEVYLKSKKSLHLRKTQHKKPLKNSTLEYFKKNEIWQMEQEFYDFVLQIFKLQVRNMISETEDGSRVWSPQTFEFAKIRPMLKRY